MDFKHEIIGLKDQGDKNHVDENVSNHGTFDKFNVRWRFRAIVTGELIFRCS